MLGVVEHEQPSCAGQRRSQLRYLERRVSTAQAACFCDLAQNRIVRGYSGQFDETDRSVEAIRGTAGNFFGEARLAYSAGTHQRQQMRGLEQRADFTYRGVATG
jgi:hypothetical protein